MSQRRPLIIHYKTSQLLWVIAGLLAVLVGAVSAGFFYGDRSFSESHKYIVELQDGVDQLSENLRASQNSMATLQLTAQVDAAALEQTRQQLVDMQRQLYRREQELKLYREMLQDNNKPTGLLVGDFHIVRAGERLFQYDWVVQQKTHEAKNLRVNAKIWVVGTQDGETKSLPLNEIDADIDDLPIQLRLKYFSINRGLIRLPEGFSPEFVRITLGYPWIEKPQFEKKFVWRVQE